MCRAVPLHATCCLAACKTILQQEQYRREVANGISCIQFCNFHAICNAVGPMAARRTRYIWSCSNCCTQQVLTASQTISFSFDHLRLVNSTVRLQTRFVSA